jgi:hypothetical protein
VEAKHGALASPILVRCPIHSCIALASCFSDDKGSMDVFSAYRDDLSGRDLDPKTQVRYWQIITNYQKWLGGKSPDIASAKQFLAYLRSKGYRPRSILLYYHALRTFFDFIGQPLRLKLRKPREGKKRGRGSQEKNGAAGTFRVLTSFKLNRVEINSRPSLFNLCGHTFQAFVQC